MNRTITIRATGSASAVPDTIELQIALKSLYLDYHETMIDATNKHAHILKLLEPLEFTREQFKTLNFAVDALYDSVNDGFGGYQRVFRGYQCDHALLLTFPFSMRRLSQALFYLARSEAAPELSIRFTLKNVNTLRAKALMNATADAYRRADVLTKASRTVLGEILEIKQEAQDENVFSSITTYGGARRASMLMDAAIEIQPEDVTIRETVAITWALK